MFNRGSSLGYLFFSGKVRAERVGCVWNMGPINSPSEFKGPQLHEFGWGIRALWNNSPLVHPHPWFSHTHRFKHNKWLKRLNKKHHTPGTPSFRGASISWCPGCRWNRWTNQPLGSYFGTSGRLQTYDHHPTIDLPWTLWPSITNLTCPLRGWFGYMTLLFH